MRLPHRLQGQKVKSQDHGAGAYCGGHLAAQLVLSVILSLCVQPISLKLDLVIGSTSWKNWLTFGGDPVFDADSRSLLHFPRRCGGDFKRFIGISHTVTGRFSRHSRSDWRRQDSESTTFFSNPADIRIRIQINPEILIWILDHFRLRLAEVCTRWAPFGSRYCLMLNHVFCW